MTTVYVLIILGWVNGKPIVPLQVPGFASEALCRAAKDQVHEDWRIAGNGLRPPLSVSCVRTAP
jgi:hypothetical protein